MGARGFTVVELIIVMFIIGIVLSISTLNFHSMQQKSLIEKQTREICTDLVSLRINAMQRKQRSAAFLGPKQIVYKSYSSNAEDVLTGGTTMATINVSFEIRRLSGATLNALDVTGDHIEYDTRGYTNNNITLAVLPVSYNSGDNCIIVHTARTNIGRMMNASTCTVR